MALTFNRPAFRGSAADLPVDATWWVAGGAMLTLAACTFFLLPEESFAIASGLMILLLALADLRVGFLAFVALYPFLPSSWGVDVADWMPYLTAKRICCLALSLSFMLHGKGAWDTPRVRGIGWFLVALITVQTIAGFGSHDPLGAVKRTFGDAVEWYLPFLIASHLFRTRTQIRLLVTIALVAMGISAVLAIVEHSLDYNFYDTFVAARADIQALLTQSTETYRAGDFAAHRVRVAFNHPIELGLHLMVVLLLATYILRQRGLFNKVALVGGLPIFLIALLFTYSRGPMLGLVFGLLWLGLVGRGSRTLLPIILFCGFLAYSFMPPNAREVLDHTIATTTDIETGDSVGGGTVRARLNLIEAGLALSQQNLWFGVGPGELRQRKVNAGHGEFVDFSSVDNFYLQVLLRHGAIVLAMTVGFYLYLLGLFTSGAYRLVDRDAAILSGIAAAMCVANYVALTTVGINITLFWILLGPAVRVCDMYQPVSRRKGTPRRRPNTRGVGMRAPRSLQSPPETPLPAAVGSAFAALTVPACLRASVLGLCFWLAAGCTQAAPSFYGTTGLFAVPTAAVAPRGAWSLGASYVEKDFRPGAASDANATVAHHFTMTLLPRLEVTALLNNFEGHPGAQRLDTGPTADHNLAGYDVDRMIGAQWQVRRQKGSTPAVSLGIRDIFGTDQQLRTQYGVTSLTLTPFGATRPMTLTLGVGTRMLGGAFGGVEFALHPRASAIIEAMRGQTNGGLRLSPLKNIQLDAALMGFRSLGGGMSYRRRF